MYYGIISRYFGDEPMIICAPDSTVIGVNESADRRAWYVGIGERLFDRMYPIDILKYMVAFDNHGVGILKDVPLRSFHGFPKCTIIIDEILARRFAVVCLVPKGKQFNPEGEMQERATGQQAARFVSAISDASEDLFYETEADEYVVDLISAVPKCIEGILRKSRSIDLSADVVADSSAASSEHALFPMGLSNLMRLLTAMLHVANDLSDTGKVSVVLKRYGDEYELDVSLRTRRLSAEDSNLDDIARTVPTCSLLVALCRYIAGTNNCTVEADVKGGSSEVVLRLIFNRSVPDGLDLKSRNPYASFDEKLEGSLKYFDMLSGAQQESQEQ